MEALPQDKIVKKEELTHVKTRSVSSKWRKECYIMEESFLFNSAIKLHKGNIKFAEGQPRNGPLTLNA